MLTRSKRKKSSDDNIITIEKPNKKLKNHKLYKLE